MKLKFLDISNNKINQLGAFDIGRMLLNNQCLSVLFVHYNQLCPVGGQHIAEGLVENKHLQVLDISFCSLGKPTKQADGMQNGSDDDEEGGGKKKPPPKKEEKKESPQKDKSKMAEGQGTQALALLSMQEV